MRLCITRPKPVSALRSFEPDEMRHLPTSVAPPLPLHTRSSGPCTSPHPCRQSCSFIRLCCAPRRQASPGCKERPIYLSGRRRAEWRRFLVGEENPAFASMLWCVLCTRSQFDSALEISFAGNTGRFWFVENTPIDLPSRDGSAMSSLQTEPLSHRGEAADCAE